MEVISNRRSRAMPSVIVNRNRNKLHKITRILSLAADSFDLETLLNILEASPALFKIMEVCPEILQIYKFRFDFVSRLGVNVSTMNLTEVHSSCKHVVKNITESIAKLYNRSGNETDGCKTKYFLEFLGLLSKIGPKTSQIIDLLMLEDQMSHWRRKRYPADKSKTMLTENPVFFLALAVHIKYQGYDDDSILKKRFCRMFSSIKEHRNVNEDNSGNLDNHINTDLEDQYFEIAYSSWGELAGAQGNPYQYRSRDIRHYERFPLTDILKELELSDDQDLESNRFLNRLMFHTNTMTTMVSLRDPLLRAYTIKSVVDELASNAG